LVCPVTRVSLYATPASGLDILWCASPLGRSLLNKKPPVVTGGAA
jgi:hypothetical protein